MSRQAPRNRRSKAAAAAAMPQAQRGAAAVFATVALIAMIISALLGINIGRLYYAQRDLQKQASLAAMAGAQMASGCRAGGIPSTDTSSGSALWNKVQATITGNNGNSSAQATSVMTGINGSAAIVLGWVNDANKQSFTSDAGTTYTTPDDHLRHFIALPNTDSHVNAVQVNLSEPAPLLIGASLFGFTPPTLVASATAEQKAVGSFYLGTGIANLDGGALNLLLGTLLCAPGDTVCQNKIIALNIGSASTGLANVNVSLGQLATALGVSVQDLSNPLALSTQTPVLSSVLNNLAGALGSTVSTTVSTTLQNLAAASTNPNGVPLGQLLGTVDAVAADVPFIDLQDLILALGQAATAGPNGQVQPISLPVSLDIPNVATVRLFINIGAPPKLAVDVRAGQGCMPSCAKTSEISLLFRLQLGSLLTNLLGDIQSILNGLLSVLQIINVNLTVTPATSVNIGFDVNVAQATARLDALQCPALPTSTSQTVPNPVASLSASPAIAVVNIGTFTGTLPAQGAAGAVPPLSAQNNWQVAAVNLDASHACVGLQLGGACIGVPLNLGSAGFAIDLGLTNLTVGNPSNVFDTLSNVTSYTIQQSPNALPGAPQFYYLADGAPGSPNASAVNPQTVGSPIALNLNLALTTPTTGSGLTGALVNLLGDLINGVVKMLKPLLDLVNTTVLALVNELLQILGVQLGTATVTMDTVIVAPPDVVTTQIPAPPATTP